MAAAKKAAKRTGPTKIGTTSYGPNSSFSFGYEASKKAPVGGSPNHKGYERGNSAYARGYNAGLYERGGKALVDKIGLRVDAVKKPGMASLPNLGTAKKALAKKQAAAYKASEPAAIGKKVSAKYAGKKLPNLKTQ